MFVQPSIQLQHPPVPYHNNVAICNQSFDFSPREDPVTIHADGDGDGDGDGRMILEGFEEESVGRGVDVGDLGETSAILWGE